MKNIGYDKRPRFGYTDDFDETPMFVREDRDPMFNHPCVVIPLPNLSHKIQVWVRKIARAMRKYLWP